MPISFEPQQAYNSRIAEAYGSSLAAEKNRDYALRATAQAAEASARNASISQADDHFYAQLQQNQNVENQREGNQNYRQDAQIGSQFGLQQQHADLQAQLSQTQLNQAEDMRRQRLERQVEYVTANSGEGQKYTAEDGQSMITQLRTGLNPYQERIQRAQALRQEIDNQTRQHFMAQQTAMMNANNSATADTVSRNTGFQLRNPNTGEASHYLVPEGFHAIPIESRASANQRDPSAMTPQTINQIHDHVERQVDAIVNNRQFSVPDSFSTIPDETPEARKERYREDQIQRRVAQRIRRFGGTAQGGNVEDETQRLQSLLGGLIQGIAPRVTPAMPATQPAAAPNLPDGFASGVGGGMS